MRSFDETNQEQKQFLNWDYIFFICHKNNPAVPFK